jgi:hypothetical protein
VLLFVMLAPCCPRLLFSICARPMMEFCVQLPKEHQVSCAYAGIPVVMHIQM